MQGKVRRYKSIFLSDIHLGTRGCNADYLLEFIKYHDADNFYLVGDIVDCWKLKKNWYWPQAHNDVVQKILRKARKGSRVIYITGNHDEIFRDYFGIHFGGIEVAEEAVHIAADGKKYLVMHGDAFDGVLLNAKWLAYLGDWAYETCLKLNTVFNYCRRKLGFGYWSLSAYLKFKVKNAVQFIYDFENLLIEEARRREVDGVICGHIHHAEIRKMDGIVYMNDGDWVESCTALVEDKNGKFRIIDWVSEREAILTDEELHKKKPRSKNKNKTVEAA